MVSSNIPGYTYGAVGPSPVSLDDLDLLKKTVTVEKMYTAWFKAITLTSLLWCHPYIKDGEF